MVVHINTIAFSGIKPILVDVQVHMTPGKFNFSIVGLPDKLVNESKERVLASLTALGFSLPFCRMTVNLSPADINKGGSHYDLPIALGLFAHMEILPKEQLLDYIIMGELFLDGTVTKVPGVLPASLHASDLGLGIICPYENVNETFLAPNIKVIPAKNIINLVNHFKGKQILSAPKIDSPNLETKISKGDFADVKGQYVAKRGFEIAAAGGHNVLMVGPPGSGKSMLSSRLPSILPPLTAKEILEVNMIASIKGLINKGDLIIERPFRSPHHSCSTAAMVGGGRKAEPGEITLAHNGVLFLDELPEFPRDVLESLRQPLETGNITVARAQAHVTYPANFQLIAAMNPCRCGYLGDPDRGCSLAPNCGKTYQAKLSGPLIDRIDLRIEVSPVDFKELREHDHNIEKSEIILQRVLKAQEIQKKRYLGQNFYLNSQADGELLRSKVLLSNNAQTLLDKAFERLKLSMRSYHRILKVARTIADLCDNEFVEETHIAEALSFKR